MMRLSPVSSLVKRAIWTLVDDFYVRVKQWVPNLKFCYLRAVDLFLTHEKVPKFEVGKNKNFYTFKRAVLFST